MMRHDPTAHTSTQGQVPPSKCALSVHITMAALELKNSGLERATMANTRELTGQRRSKQQGHLPLHRHEISHRPKLIGQERGRSTHRLSKLRRSPKRCESGNSQSQEAHPESCHTHRPPSPNSSRIQIVAPANYNNFLHGG